MLIYVYHKCSTCRDALRYLEKKQIVFTVKEITLETPSLSELEQMYHFQNKKLSKLFNTSGLKYKELNLKEKLAHLSLEAVFKLLHENGMLIKRPFLLGKKFGLVGFKEEEWQKAFEKD